MSWEGRGEMIEDEQDEATFEKILEAAEDIKDMARVRPAEAPEMLEKARHLMELAGQIKSDLLRRKEADLPSIVSSPTVDGTSLRRVPANTEARPSASVARARWLEDPVR
jgi:hypothetical protein